VVSSEVSPDEYEGIPATDGGTACLDDCGQRATEYVRDRLTGEEVTLRLDPDSDTRGDFGRLLGYLVLDDDSLNYDLVAEGYARVYDSEFSERDRFNTAESDAQTAGAGFWECQTHTPTPTATPAGDGDLIVAEIHEDAQGDERENLDDEYITLENTGSGAIDMTGYTLSDEANHTFAFPDGFTLKPGAQVTVYTGHGENSSTELYWGYDAPVWNNGGDTIFVRDPNWQIVLERSYD
jgi:micrococcal nuclease